MAAEQIIIHKITEALAVIIAIYFIWLAQRRWFKKPHRYVLIIFSIATIIVDGYLFFTW